MKWRQTTPHKLTLKMKLSLKGDVTTLCGGGRTSQKLGTQITFFLKKNWPSKFTFSLFEAKKKWMRIYAICALGSFPCYGKNNFGQSHDTHIIT